MTFPNNEKTLIRKVVRMDMVPSRIGGADLVSARSSFRQGLPRPNSGVICHKRDAWRYNVRGKVTQGGLSPGRRK